MAQVNIRLLNLVKVFAHTGASSFGGWSTTSLLLEKELVEKRKVLTSAQLKGGVTYAQILPGATQVSIVANAGYRLHGLMGALVATASYLFPAISLITLFAIVYFHFAHGGNLAPKLDGLVAALSGVILANAYKIGGKHVSKGWLWSLALIAFFAKLVFDVNALVIIITFGVGGLLISWTKVRKAIQ